MLRNPLKKRKLHVSGSLSWNVPVLLCYTYYHNHSCEYDVQVMKVVNDLIKVPELNQTMQQMSKEMMKAGLIEETMGEMMDDAFDTDDIEEDADTEVDKVSI